MIWDSFENRVWMCGELSHRGVKTVCQIWCYPSSGRLSSCYISGSALANTIKAVKSNAQIASIICSFRVWRCRIVNTPRFTSTGHQLRQLRRALSSQYRLVFSGGCQRASSQAHNRQHWRLSARFLP